jgi:SAM-dependent methyltransferase
VSQPPALNEQPLSQRQRKWDEFWRGPRVEAEATHRVSAELALAALRAERFGRAPRVLDLGCGAGRVMELLAAGGCEVVGLDLAEGALAAACERLGPGARLVRGDAFHLGFSDASFEAVVSLGYASVGSYPGVQGELARVLRPGGLALVDFRRFGLYHLPLAPLRARQFARAWRRGEVSLPLLGLRPGPTWAAAGFRLEGVRLFNTYPPLGRRVPVGAALAFERSVGRPLKPVLARTALAVFRRERAGVPIEPPELPRLV